MYKDWYLKQLQENTGNELRVFSCFSCGGGSSMGYKLAGYQMVGNCEIDEKMAELYKHNLHPAKSYVMDIREFKELLKTQAPADLKNIDILDGSPPCSVFSMAGQRENDWGRTKAFREGQAAQTLDDLFFEFIDVAELLQPKVIVAENVRGLICGNAKGYVTEIIKNLKMIGYKVQIFLLNSAFMGVPQRRERVFFIAHKAEYSFPRLNLQFDEQPIYFSEIKGGELRPLGARSKLLWYWKQRKESDNNIGDVAQRIYGKAKGFNSTLIHDNQVAPTLTAGGCKLRYSEPSYLTNVDMIRMQTFPADYDFMDQSVQYVCGMSVPPVMMQRIAKQIKLQWFDNM